MPVIKTYIATGRRQRLTELPGDPLTRTLIISEGQGVYERRQDLQVEQLGPLRQLQQPRDLEKKVPLLAGPQLKQRHKELTTAELLAARRSCVELYI